jgi:hypothetical protein
MWYEELSLRQGTSCGGRRIQIISLKPDYMMSDGGKALNPKNVPLHVDRTPVHWHTSTSFFTISVFVLCSLFALLYV